MRLMLILVILFCGAGDVNGHTASTIHQHQSALTAFYTNRWATTEVTPTQTTQYFSSLPSAGTDYTSGSCRIITDVSWAVFAGILVLLVGGSVV
jgi:hypothetical protein